MKPVAADPSPVTPATGWNIETVLLHVLAILSERDARIIALVTEKERRYEQQFASSKVAVDAALAAADRANLKAETANDKRFEGVNEFRAQLGDQQRTFIPRSEVDLIEKALSTQLAELQNQLKDALPKLMPRLESVALHAASSDKIHKLEAALQAVQAERVGIKNGWGYAVGVVMFMIAVGAVVFAFNK